PLRAGDEPLPAECRRSRSHSAGRGSSPARKGVVAALLVSCVVSKSPPSSLTTATRLLSSSFPKKTPSGGPRWREAPDGEITSSGSRERDHHDIPVCAAVRL